VAPCKDIHARLEPGADNILVRIWPVGTKRLLGWTREDVCTLPENIRAAMDAGRTIYAVVTIRPLTQSQPGHMQFVCIAAAR